MSAKEFSNETFAPPSPSVGIDPPGHPLASSSKPGKKGQREEQLPPDDMRFTGQQLVTLFLKLDFSVRTRELLLTFD